jgi:hypothetical protein
MTLFLIHRTSSKQKIIEQLEFKSSSITNKTLFAGSSKKKIIFFNLLFDYTYKNKLFKNNDTLPDSILLKEKFLNRVIKKNNVYLNYGWHGTIHSTSILLTNENLNKELKKLKKHILKTDIAYFHTHEIIVENTTINIFKNDLINNKTTLEDLFK